MDGPDDEEAKPEEKAQAVGNPDEILIDLEDDADMSTTPSQAQVAANPDEIHIEDEEDLVQSEASTLQREQPVAGAEELKADEEEAEVAKVLNDERPRSEATPSEPQQAERKEWGEGKAWRETRFLALDKCLPRRQYLEVVDIPSASPVSSPSEAVELTYDTEWLGITRAFNSYMSTVRNQARYPEEAEARKAVETEVRWVEENVLHLEVSEDGEGREEARHGKRIDEVQTFVQTAPGPQSPGNKTLARVSRTSYSS